MGCLHLTETGLLWANFLILEKTKVIWGKCGACSSIGIGLPAKNWQIFIPTLWDQFLTHTFFHIHFDVKICLMISSSTLTPLLSFCCLNHNLFSQELSPFSHFHQFAVLLNDQVVSRLPRPLSFENRSCQFKCALKRFHRQYPFIRKLMLGTAFFIQHDHFKLKKFVKISFNITSMLQCDLEHDGVGLPVTSMSCIYCADQWKAMNCVQLHLIATPHS